MKTQFDLRSRGWYILSIFLTLMLWGTKAYGQGTPPLIDGYPYILTETDPTGWPYVLNNPAIPVKGIINDPFSFTGDNILVQGSKTDQPISSWRWTDQKSTPKVDLSNVGFAINQDPVVSSPTFGHTFLYCFFDRIVNNGSCTLGFWLFKNGDIYPNPAPDNTFHGEHAIGDLYVQINLVNGGAQADIRVAKWNGTGLDSINSAGYTRGVVWDIFSNQNLANVPSGWPFPSVQYDQYEFFEGYLDLNLVGGAPGQQAEPCYSRALITTLTSGTSWSAEMKDFVMAEISTKPKVSVNNPVICQGAPSVTFTATTIANGGIPFYDTSTTPPTPYFMYSWNGGTPTTSNTLTVNPAIVPFAVVVAIGANGCYSDPDTGIVVVNPKPNPTAGNNGPICVGKTLNLTSSGGTSYLWKGPDGFTSTLQNPTRTDVTAAMAGIYKVIVTNAAGCVDSTTTTVVINTLPTPTIGSNTPVCVGKTLNLTSGGGTSYLWKGPNGFTSTLQNPSIPNVTLANAGTYKVIVTNAAGCVDSITTNVVINTLPTPTIGSNTPVCVGKTLNLTSGGGTSYQWKGPNGFTSALQNPSIPNVTLANAGTYKVIVTNAAGCVDSITTNVVINALPTPTIGSNTPVCVGKTLNLTSGGGTSYQWKGPNGFTSALQNPSIPNVTLANAGTYKVIVTNAAGCVDSITTNVVINALPTPTIGSNTPVCVGKTLNLTSGGGTSYLWKGPNGFTSALQNPSIPNVTLANAGTYKVIVTNAAGCVDSITTNVVINALPTPTIGSNTPVCVGKTLNLTSGGGTSYLWKGPNGFTSALQNPSIPNVTLANAGTYKVIVTNAAGCVDSITTNVVINALPT
ncbi:hypothetical protein, partial [Parabacteroides sp. FAFU027]|uniref:hypothetical protein n=1 Tax=Parabacteroides sp. FAFU027 TaxID=2922715 RepID=UPI001FAF58C8